MSEKCSDNNQKCEYESIGTLSYRASSEISLFFVPDSDHLLEYSANSYAVFVGPPLPDSINHRKAREALTVRLGHDDDGVFLKKSIPIKVSRPKRMRRILQVARRAAEQHTKVTLTVTRKRRSFKLMSVTVPS